MSLKGCRAGVRSTLGTGSRELCYSVDLPVLSDILKGNFSTAASWGRSGFPPWFSLLIKRDFFSASRHVCCWADPNFFFVITYGSASWRKEKIHSLTRSSREQIEHTLVIFLLPKLLHCHFLIHNSLNYTRKFPSSSKESNEIQCLKAEYLSSGFFTALSGFYIFI